MSRLSNARRYAQAAFALALEQDDLDGWLEGLHTLADAMANDELRAFLAAPLIPDEVKLSALKSLLPKSDALLHNLAGVLLERGQQPLLTLIAGEFQVFVDQERGIERATITTAVPVGDEVISSIRQRLEELTGKKIVATTDVSPDILGGFVAQVGDQLIDGSTRSRLNQLRAKMIAGEA